MKIPVKFFTTICIIIACCFKIHAQEASQQDTDSWNFQLTPYLWMAGISGDVTFLNQTVPVELEFKDLLKNLNFTAMLHAEAGKNRWIIMADILYMDLKTDGTIELPLMMSVDTETQLEQLNLEFGGGYTFLQENEYFIDGLIGVRYFDISTEVNTPNQQLIVRTVNSTDPFIGVRFRADWEKWLASIRFDIGGFGLGSSEVSWKTNAMAGYRFSDLFSLLLGYQFYVVDIEEEGFALYDATSGIALGLNFRF